MDERLLAAVRRFWTEQQVSDAYEAVLAAYASSAIKSVEIIGNTFDGQGAQGAIVLDREGMILWMDILEARMKELESEDSGDTPALITGSPITDFSQRYVGT
jgi:hypothetical protein